MPGSSVDKRAGCKRRMGDLAGGLHFRAYERVSRGVLKQRGLEIQAWDVRVGGTDGMMLCKLACFACGLGALHQLDGEYDACLTRQLVVCGLSCPTGILVHYLSIHATQSAHKRVIPCTKLRNDVMKSRSKVSPWSTRSGAIPRLAHGKFSLMRN